MVGDRGLRKTGGTCDDVVSVLGLLCGRDFGGDVLPRGGRPSE
jgi:hypothetical protein